LNEYSDWLLLRTTTKKNVHDKFYDINTSAYGDKTFKYQFRIRTV